MTIFFLLNAMGVIFLSYVLVNFWIEEHRPKKAVRDSRMDFMRRNKPGMFIVIRPASRNTQKGVSVIPTRSRARKMQGMRHIG